MLEFFKKRKKQKMFTRIKIMLTGPICSCAEEGLSWGIQADERGQYGMYIQCTECKVRLSIPHKQFKAQFVLEQPYPGKPVEPTKLEVIDGGKVLDIS